MDLAAEAPLALTAAAAEALLPMDLAAEKKRESASSRALPV